MKQTPQLDAVEARMRSGGIVREGFLGSDRRSLSEILDEDQNAINHLGVTHQQIAERMEHLCEEGKRGLGTTVHVDEDFEVSVQSVRGFLPCPWGHKGLYPKLNVHVRNRRSGRTMLWTGMQIHLIRDHGFYQGRGSGFRIEPQDAVEILALKATQTSS
jgi:hypothetical protein